MKPLENMTEAEMLAEVESGPELTPLQRKQLEHEMYLVHYIRGWTGDPLCQPASTVLAILRRIQGSASKTPEPRTDIETQIEKIH